MILGLARHPLVPHVPRAYRRTQRFAEQLPDAMQLVVGSLKSGFSLGQSVDALVREAADPVAAEFGRALAESRLGAELEDALDRAAVRAKSQDLAWIVMAVRIQREVGGNLAEVLQTSVETMRERVRLRRHVKALSAEGRLSAWVLLALPIGIATYMYLLRREYFQLLTPNPWGSSCCSDRSSCSRSAGLDEPHGEGGGVTCRSRS